MLAYEILGLRPDRTIFRSAVFENDVTPEHEADAAAYAVAEHYAELWGAVVELYKTPALNLTSTSSFDLWPGEVSLIAEIERHDYACDAEPITDDDIPF